MQNKFYFFIEFIIGFILLLLSLFIFVFGKYFFYNSIRLFGLIIIFNALFGLFEYYKKSKKNLLNITLSIIVGFFFCFAPSIPISLFIIVFALYIFIKGLSQFITYCYYRKNDVDHRLILLLSSLLFIIFSISLLLSPYIHLYQVTLLLNIYLFYLSFSFILKSIREIISENRQNSIKRRIHVSLPVLFNAFIPRIMVEYINQKLEVNSLPATDYHNTQIEVYIHVSKDGFGAVGHVDIAYQNEVYAYGAYDDLSNHLLGALGDGVLFIADKKKYINFCLQDDPQSTIFGYTLQLNQQQIQLVESRIQQLKSQIFPFSIENHPHDSYATRLQKATSASFYKFKEGKFKNYFVLTTNCVLLADYIIGSSGIDIIGINGIITPGSYYSYFEEESKKEYSRVYKKVIYTS